MNKTVLEEWGAEWGEVSIINTGSCYKHDRCYKRGRERNLGGKFVVSRTRSQPQDWLSLDCRALKKM